MYSDGVFPIVKVLHEQFADIEQLGSKDKFWFWRDDRKWLFKEVRLIHAPEETEPSGEDWAEKVAAELAILLEIPAARVELAEFEGKAGSATLNFTTESHQLVHGNEVMAGYFSNYDPSVRFGQSDHTFENISAALNAHFPEKSGGLSALTQFASYMVLDALIGNTDRHHENWGMLWQVQVTDLVVQGSVDHHFSMAPSFDHASSLGRELMDKKREQLLAARHVPRYMRKGRGGIYFSNSKKGANPLTLVETTFAKHPDCFLPVLQRLRATSIDSLVHVVDRLPAERASAVARDLAKEMLSVAYTDLNRLVK